MHLPQRLLAAGEASDLQAQLAAIVDSSFDAILSKNLDGTLTSWNLAAERLYGYSREEVIGRHISLLVPPERRAELDGIMRRIAQGERVEPFETVRVCKDGTRIDVFLTVSPVKEDAGRVVGASAIARDITERKRAQDELNRHREQLRDFLENAVLGLHWVGPDGTILWANRAEMEMLGYCEEEYVGHNIAEFHVDRETICDILERLSQNEALHNCEARLRARDGSIRHVLISSNVYRENGKFIHTRCFTRDISQLKAAERQRELLIRELDHRVKNTLAIVQSVCQQTMRSAASLENFGEAFGSRLQAIASTHALLAAHNWSRTELRDVIEAIVGPYRESDSIVLRPGRPLLLKPAAALHVGMALNELMTNSAKYGALSAPGGQVRLAWRMNGGGELEISWSESGGPEVRPPERQGFGTTLIEKGTALQFGGRARIDFAAAGLQCEIALPSHVVAEPRGGAPSPAEAAAG